MSKKLHAAVAITTFSSESIQTTSASDHFLKFRCRKIARSTREAHFQLKVCKKISFGPLFEVPMSKNCTPLLREAHFQLKMLKKSLGALFEVPTSKNCTPFWREAHFQVKMYKTCQLRTVARALRTVARSTFPTQNVSDEGEG